MKVATLLHFCYSFPSRLEGTFSYLACGPTIPDRLFHGQNCPHNHSKMKKNSPTSSEDDSDSESRLCSPPYRSGSKTNEPSLCSGASDSRTEASVEDQNGRKPNHIFSDADSVSSQAHPERPRSVSPCRGQARMEERAYIN